MNGSTYHRIGDVRYDVDGRDYWLADIVIDAERIRDAGYGPEDRDPIQQEFFGEADGDVDAYLDDILDLLQEWRDSPELFEEEEQWRSYLPR